VGNSVKGFTKVLSSERRQTELFAAAQKSKPNRTSHQNPSKVDFSMCQ